MGVRLILCALALLASAARPVVADERGYEPFVQTGGGQVPPFVMMCAKSPTDRTATPCGTMAGPFIVMTLPFTRLHSAPIRLQGLTTTPKVFPIARPEGATTYRVVIPCDVNVRLLGAKTADEVLTDDAGVLYLAGTDVTMGTSRPNFIIAKTTATPGSDCTPEMHYGMGGG